MLGKSPRLTSLVPRLIYLPPGLATTARDGIATRTIKEHYSLEIPSPAEVSTTASRDKQLLQINRSLESRYAALQAVARPAGWFRAMLSIRKVAPVSA